MSARIDLTATDIQTIREGLIALRDSLPFDVSDAHNTCNGLLEILPGMYEGQCATCENTGWLGIGLDIVACDRCEKYKSDAEAFAAASTVIAILEVSK